MTRRESDKWHTWRILQLNPDGTDEWGCARCGLRITIEAFTSRPAGPCKEPPP